MPHFSVHAGNGPGRCGIWGLRAPARCSTAPQGASGTTSKGSRLKLKLVRRNRAGHGQLTLDLSDYSLKEVVHTVFTAVESLATGKKLALRIDVASNLPRGHLHKAALVAMLLNLVGNAIKFTDKGEVAIKATVTYGSFPVLR